MFKMEFPTGISGRSYRVEKKKDKHYQVCFCWHGDKKFITHRENSKQATKLAKLLAETYYQAYCEGAY